MVRATDEASWRTPRRLLRRVLWCAVGAAGCVGLFFGYLRMSRSQPTNSDGSGNALQAWDMLHGNLLLHGWTVSDVPFYTTELPQYALVELLYGLRADVVHVAAAMTYTLLVLAAAVLAKGRAKGVAGLVRAGIAVAILLVPEPGTAYLTVLNSPDHTGSGVPVLLTWIVLERGLTRPDGSYRPAPRWLPYTIGALLAWGAIGDTLITVTAALPLVVISGLRLARRSPERGADWRLLGAGVAGIVLAQVGLRAIRLAGGFSTHAVSMSFVDPGRLGRNLWIAVVGLSVNFGLYPKDLSKPGYAVAAVHLVGLVAVVAAALLVAVRTVRARTDDRVASLLAVGILANLGAFLISTLPFDALSARQIVSILPLGAALAGRVYGPVAMRSLRVARGCVPALAAVLLGLSVAFGVQASVARPVPPANQDITDWLLAQGLTEGIGGYWSSEVIMLSTGGRLTVAPLSSAASYLPWVYAYRWESKADWFDPTRHDARFIVIDKEDPAYGSVDAALMQFGEPVQRKDFGRFAVLVYHHNLLVGLPAVCGAGHTAATMARCPRD